MTKACIVVVGLLAAFPCRTFGQAAPVAPPANAGSANAAPTQAAPAQAAPTQAAPTNAGTAKADLTDPKQIAAAMEKAAQYQQNKEYEQARSIYQEIISAQHKGETNAAACWAIAQSYNGEGKIALAAPFLEMILADKSEAPPKLIDDARTLLAESRMSIADNFVKLKKYDAAVVTLQRTVNDKQASNAAVRLALLAIAKADLAMNKKVDAIATYRLLLTKPAVGDKERVADIVALTTLAPASVDELEAYIKSHAGTAPENIATAYSEIGRAYLQLKQLGKAAAAYNALLAMKKIPFSFVRDGLVGKAKLAVLSNDTPGAIDIYRDLLLRPVKATMNGTEYASWDRLADIESLIALDPNGDVTEEVAAYLNHVWSLGDINLSSAAPGNDVLYPIMCVQLNPDVIERYARFLRESTGRASQSDLNAVVAQLTKGGDFRPFVTSQFSKEVAKQISRDAPMGDFLKPLLNGEYQVAARAAWKLARLSREETEHETWIQATALALACQDQYRGGRAAAFLKWANPDAPVTAANKGVTPDSLVKYLDDAPLPLQPTDEELAAAAAQLNKIKTITWSLDPVKLFGQVLPDNGVLPAGVYEPF